MIMFSYHNGSPCAWRHWISPEVCPWNLFWHQLGTMWVKQCHFCHPPVITSNRWFFNHSQVAGKHDIVLPTLESWSYAWGPAGPAGWCQPHSAWHWRLKTSDLWTMPVQCLHGQKVDDPRCARVASFGDCGDWHIPSNLGGQDRRPLLVFYKYCLLPACVLQCFRDHSLDLGNWTIDTFTSTNFGNPSGLQDEPWTTTRNQTALNLLLPRKFMCE